MSAFFKVLALTVFCAFEINIAEATTSSDTAALSSAQCKNKPIRVAVVEGGPYTDFQRVFKHMVLSLMDMDLITKIDLPKDYLFDEGDSFKTLQQNTKGGCIEFVKNGLYNPNWDDTARESTNAELLKRIKNSEVDMVWAFGTKAGQDFADSSLGVPVMVVTPSDPELSGIVGAGEFSDKKNIHAQKEQGRFFSELGLFYDIFKFKTLGVTIDDEKQNQDAQAFGVIKDFASKNNVDLKICYGDVTTDDVSKAKTEYSRCVKELAEQNVDAVYLTMSTGADEKDLYSQIQPLLDAQIPTFSQSGVSEVRRGSLMALSEGDMEESGRFEANVMRQIVEGKNPEEISQYYNAPLVLGINLKTASLIEWKLTFDILIAVDTVFQNIERQ